MSHILCIRKLLICIITSSFGQLEAIIRISEALAKMTLSPHASERHVDEAIRLFNFSTMNAIQSGMGMYEIANNDHLTALSCFCIVEGVSRGKFSEVQQVESVIRRDLPWAHPCLRCV